MGRGNSKEQRKKTEREERAAGGGAKGTSWFGSLWPTTNAADEQKRRRARKRVEVPGSDDESARSSGYSDGSGSSDVEDPRNIRSRITTHRSSAGGSNKKPATRRASTRSSNGAVVRGSSRRRPTTLSMKLLRLFELLLSSLRNFLPQSNHGWGMLMLCLLMTLYLFDFFAVLRSSPPPAESSYRASGPSLAVKSSNSSSAHLPDTLDNTAWKAATYSSALEAHMPQEPHNAAKASTKTSTAALNLSKSSNAAESEESSAGRKGERKDAADGEDAVEGEREKPSANTKTSSSSGSSAKSEGESPSSSSASKKTKETSGEDGAEKKDSADEAKASEAVPEWIEKASLQSVSPFNRGARKDLMVSADLGVLPRAEVERYYRQLARAYLEPFAALKGVPRKYFVEILKRRTYALTPPGANKGTTCVLVQIVDQRVYLLDPYEVRKNAKPFYRTRMDEVLWLLSRVAARTKLRNTEFLVSIHDCVQTASAEHSYRAASFVEHSPVFTIVGCNFSDNIPLPMWEGSGERGGGYSGWDKQMELFARDATPWEAKDQRGVFRGGVRPSMYFRDKAIQDEHCDDVGRTALLSQGINNLDLLDVSIGGTCGGTHHSLARLAPEVQHKYKYIIYAEGNCFWADRLNRELFGPSTLLKQETPCGQFYEPLLQPMGHYVPVDFFFKDLPDRVRWLRENDAEARRMVHSANDFARDFLSLAGIEIYVHQLLREYTSLLTEPVKREKGAVDVTVEDAAAF